MAQHTRPEALRQVLFTITGKMPTCHRCSWAWSKGAFTLKRPSAACEDRAHRRLLEAQAPAPSVNLSLQAS